MIGLENYEIVSEVFVKGSSSILASCKFILGYSSSLCANSENDIKLLTSETVLISSRSSIVFVLFVESAAFSSPYLSLCLCYSS